MCVGRSHRRCTSFFTLPTDVRSLASRAGCTHEGTATVEKGFPSGPLCAAVSPHEKVKELRLLVLISSIPARRRATHARPKSRTLRLSRLLWVVLSGVIAYGTPPHLEGQWPARRSPSPYLVATG